MLIVVYELFVTNNYSISHTSRSLLDSTVYVIVVNICSRGTPECIRSCATMNYKCNLLFYNYISILSDNPFYQEHLKNTKFRPFIT